MTAEIAILNQHAVALAADSAVTIGSNTAPTIYPSANKLFTLSKYAPVGVMVYSNAAFMGVPWEIVIKTYRARLGRQTFPTLQGYADDLLQFIETSDMLVPEDQERRHIHERIHRFFAMIQEHVRRTVENGDRSPSEVLEDAVSTLLRDWGGASVFTGHDGTPIDSDSISLVGEWSEEVFNQVRKPWFPEIEGTSPVARNLVTLGQMSIVRLADTSIFASTGLVVAGYGEGELFPSVITNRLDFRLNGHLKHERQENKSNSINFERRAAIIPFAQSDMVATFIEGADPEYQRVVDTQVQNALDPAVNRHYFANYFREVRDDLEPPAGT